MIAFLTFSNSFPLETGRQGRSERGGGGGGCGGGNTPPPPPFAERDVDLKINAFWRCCLRLRAVTPPIYFNLDCTCILFLAC
jgi:hypothetical protein